MAYCPFSPLLEIDDDSDAVRDTLSFLKSASILQESIDGNKTIIHRLQGQVYRETYLSNQEKLNEARAHTTTLLNEVDVDRIEYFEQQRQETRNLVEQVRSTTSQDYSRPLFFDPDYVAILTTTLRNATNLGMPQLALTLIDSVTRVRDTLGTEHPGPLASRHYLADAYQDAGRLDDAITLYQQNLKDFTRIVGPDHPGTLTSRNNLASAYRASGRLQDAITLHQQNLKDSTRILGANHPGTLTSRNNLAGAYHQTDRLDKAITLYEQNLKDRIHILGPHHPDTLTTQVNLAVAYRTAGRLDEAISLQEQTLKDFENLLGPNHPLTLASRHNLADAYRAAGRIEDADKLFETPSDSEEDEQNGSKDNPDQETDN